jgi:hypothetical protein
LRDTNPLVELAIAVAFWLLRLAAVLLLIVTVWSFSTVVRGIVAWADGQGSLTTPGRFLVGALTGTALVAGATAFVLLAWPSLPLAALPVAAGLGAAGGALCAREGGRSWRPAPPGAFIDDFGDRP